MKAWEYLAGIDDDQERRVATASVYQKVRRRMAGRPEAEIKAAWDSIVSKLQQAMDIKQKETDKPRVEILEHLVSIKDDKEREIAVDDLFYKLVGEMPITGSLDDIRLELRIAADRAKVIIQQQEVAERRAKQKAKQEAEQKALLERDWIDRAIDRLEVMNKWIDRNPILGPWSRLPFWVRFFGPIIITVIVLSINTDWEAASYRYDNEERVEAGKAPYQSIEEWRKAKAEAEAKREAARIEYANNKWKRDREAIREVEEREKKRFLAEREAAKKRMYKEAAWIAEDMLRKQRGW